ncbi:VOC family protein [Herbaspirillum sp. WKF16]|jgi:catechol 2,3-dioxygenase-like lactoylglutathione lyase family enzyme|uniref:VOC family protein n=1 Tax=Herbaspirillum sp. WKF16 TaxID=3028312 RepID=UPI0023A99D4D|nr:VOC family protein [Herbaspirillum sp. WKF16]WDZ96677.1 VOC family protein [Herbaspirillum sp. WKF16]
MKYIATLFAALVLAAGMPARAAGIQTAGIDHVGINVPDLKQAEQFFGDAFGCVPVTRIGPFDLRAMKSDKGLAGALSADSLSIAMLRCGDGANIELLEYRHANGDSAMPRVDAVGAAHIAFYTDDVKAGAAYLKSRGIALLGEPVTMGGGDTEGETWVHFLTPWGADMELVGYPNGKGYEKNARVKLWKPRHPAN